MKRTRRLLAVFGVMLGIVGLIFAADSSIFQPFTLNSTSQAVTSTNSTAGATLSLYDGQTPVRIWVSAVGGFATTNGELTVRFSTASGATGTTNEFDTASASAIKVTMSTMGSATNFGGTNTVSDWFVIKGARWIRVGEVQNSFKGAVSNITVRMGYTRQP